MIKDDKEFLKELTSAIETESYDTFIAGWGDEWEIIERLVEIIRTEGLLEKP